MAPAFKDATIYVDSAALTALLVRALGAAEVQSFSLRMIE